MVEKFLEERPIVAAESIVAPKARELLQFLGSGISPYARLIECRAKENADFIVIEVQPQLSQNRVHQILPKEIIGIEFTHADLIAPQVYSLREDFPTVPHLNLMPNGYPRNLCLYEESYRQQKRYWTAAKFIEDIRHWLSLTSKGRLHGEDQPVEPMLLNSPVPLIVPSELTPEANGLLKLIVEGRFEGEQLKALNAEVGKGTIPQWKQGGFLGFMFTCPPQQHGVIHSQPLTIKELNDLLIPIGVDFIEVLSGFLKDIVKEKPAYDYPLVMVFGFPRRRTEDGPIESIDKHAFLAHKTIYDIGLEIGIWDKPPGSVEVGLFTLRDNAKNGEKINILPLNLHYRLSRQRAAILNGFSDKNDSYVVAVGAGALGSQVIINLVRSGFGLWTVIDHDNFLPHNLARHVFFGQSEGAPKSELLSWYASSIMPDEKFIRSIPVDVMAPGGWRDELHSCCLEANLILDLSADASVGRHIGHMEGYPAKRVSLFLNPSGTALIALSEDNNRSIKLDHLDVQYYAEIIENNDLVDLLLTPGRLRYGRSCRDVSATIPQDFVALLSAIASRHLHTVISQENANIAIWRINPIDLSVTSHTKSPLPMIEFQVGDWKVLILPSLFNKVFVNRAEQLPQETGGVLIGSWDTERKIVYVLDTLPAPADSIRRDTLFIRGCENLVDQVAEIERQTLWELGYVGEWHSHPDGAACQASNDDLNVLSWLNSHMAVVGLPGLMMIACQNQETSWFLGNNAVYGITCSEPSTVI